MCCGVLWCVAVRCSALQRAAVCCSVLRCVAVCCSMLQCFAVFCSVHVLQCAAVCCCVLLCFAMQPRHVVTTGSLRARAHIHIHTHTHTHTHTLTHSRTHTHTHTHTYSFTLFLLHSLFHTCGPSHPTLFLSHSFALSLFFALFPFLRFLSRTQSPCRFIDLSRARACPPPSLSLPSLVCTCILSLCRIHTLTHALSFPRSSIHTHAPSPTLSPLCTRHRLQSMLWKERATCTCAHAQGTY